MHDYAQASAPIRDLLEQQGSGSVEDHQIDAVLRPANGALHRNQIVEANHANAQLLLRQHAGPADEIAVASSIVQAPEDIERAGRGAGPQLTTGTHALGGLLQQLGGHRKPPPC